MKHLPLIFSLILIAALAPALIKAPQELAVTLQLIGDYE